jgi:threonine aldolase
MKQEDSLIDLRSDTVTRPSPEMRRVMAAAPVGDDVWGDDPTVTRLETLAAEMMGTQASLYVASGTMSNLLAIISHCQRGEEYIVGQDAHTYKYEAGGAAVLGSVQPQPLQLEPDGSIALERIRATIKPDDFHFAITRLMCLENTIGGKVLPMDYIEAASQLAQSHGLQHHLDGARVFNAAVKLGINVQDIARHFDSISVCLSKGLGAPVGSVLCGSEDFIKQARRWRKMLGGGLRQAGIIAAGGIHALENNIDRLQIDHDNAALLGNELAAIEELEVDLENVQTNMVFLRTRDGNYQGLADYLQAQNILIEAAEKIRLVTHLDMSRDDIQTVITSIKAYYARSGGKA